MSQAARADHSLGSAGSDRWRVLSLSTIRLYEDLEALVLGGRDALWCGPT